MAAAQLLLHSLPQHILFCIIDSGCTSRDVLQSYFDLLGELMKFNIDAFKRFNKYVNTAEKVELVGSAAACGTRTFPWLSHHVPTSFLCSSRPS